MKHNANGYQHKKYNEVTTVNIRHNREITLPPCRKYIILLQ